MEPTVAYDFNNGLQWLRADDPARAGLDLEVVSEPGDRLYVLAREGARSRSRNVPRAAVRVDRGGIVREIWLRSGRGTANHLDELGVLFKADPSIAGMAPEPASMVREEDFPPSLRDDIERLKPGFFRDAPDDPDDYDDFDDF